MKKFSYNIIFDRINSIKARIAYQISALPRLTIYNRIDSKEYEYEFDLDAFNLDVKKLTVKDFVNKADNLMKKYNIKSKKDYTLYWIYYNDQFYNRNKLIKKLDDLKTERKRNIFPIYNNTRN